VDECVLLFTKAYGDVALHSLNLESSYELILHKNGTANKMCQTLRQSVFNIISFDQLKQLDVSFCTAFSSTEWLDVLGQCR